MKFKPAVTLPSSNLVLINDDTTYDEPTLIKLLLEGSKRSLLKSTKILTCKVELPSLPEGTIPDRRMLIPKPYFITFGNLHQMYKEAHSGNTFRKNYRNI
ncbi:MAG: hypothetical protein AABY15_09825 [Nanoarchaeota archaeon]